MEKQLVEKYIPSAEIEYIRDYRRRLVDFMFEFNEYKVRRYAKELLQEVARIDLCVDKYYKSMEETLLSIVVGDVVTQAEVEDPVLDLQESKMNKKKRKGKNETN